MQDCQGAWSTSPLNRIIGTERRSVLARSRALHIPPDLVVDQWDAHSESSSHLGFLVYTTLRRRFVALGGLI